MWGLCKREQMFACLSVGALGSSRERTTSYRSINTPHTCRFREYPAVCERKWVFDILRMPCEVFSLTFPQILRVFFFYIARLCTQARKKNNNQKTLCMNRMWEIIHKLEDILILVFLPHPTPYALFSTPFPHLAFFSPATLSTPCTCLAH